MHSNTVLVRNIQDIRLSGSIFCVISYSVWRSVSHDCDLWNHGGPQDLFRSCQDLFTGFLRSSYFNNGTVFFFPFALSFFHGYIVFFSKDCLVSDYVITVTDNKMCLCAFLYLKDFLVLTFSRERKISVDIAHIYKSSSEFLSNS